jgi:hypothetical protein
MSQWIISQRKCFIFDQLITFFLQKTVIDTCMMTWWIGSLIVVKLQQNTSDVDTHWCRSQLLRLPDIHPRPGAHWLVRYNCQGFHVLISFGGFDIPELLLIVTTDGNKIRDWPFFIRDAPSTPTPRQKFVFHAKQKWNYWFVYMPDTNR